MSLEKRPELVKLRDRIATKIQDVPADHPPNVAFIEIWQDVKADYDHMRLEIHEYLTCLLDGKGIRATVFSRTKTIESISKSINRRDDSKPAGKKYESPRHIFDDLHDLVGFRIVVDYPSGLERSYDMIETIFHVERYNSFSSDRTVGQYWKPRFGAYETRNYLVRLDPSCVELAIYNGVLFEIQVTTMAESLYNKLAHPLLYKSSYGSLSPNDERIIDMGHGAALLYWISVACMEERLEGRFPQPVRHFAGHDGPTTDLDAVVHATPDMPSFSQVSTSIDLLLKSLADLQLLNAKGEDLWEVIRDKLGLHDHREAPIPLPTVPEARFDSKDFEKSPKCHEKTRLEIRDEIQQWVDDSNGETLFWLHAPAGVGKSTLARTLVDDLRRQGKLAAAYFFKRPGDLRNDTCRVFPTIACQLIKTIPQYTKSLRQSLGCSDVESIDKISLRDQFDTLIYDPLNSTQCSVRNMLIIIDALDECTKPNDIPLMLELFARLKDLNNLRLCVLLSSRETGPLINAFRLFNGTVTCRDMALHEKFLKATEAEMRIVLKDGLAKIKSKHDLKKDPWPTIEDFDTVLHSAINPSPLFIYTSTFLRHIDGRNPARKLKEWLESSTKGLSQLDSIYEPIMISILAGEGDDGIPEPLNEEEVFDLKLVVGSLVLLAKPLPAKTLQSLLALDEDEFSTTLKALHAVVRIPVDESPVELIHKSFADYILGTGSDTPRALKVDPSKTHDLLARLCIERMEEVLRKNICHVSNPLIRQDEFDRSKVMKSIPSDLVYACTYWVYHVEPAHNAIHLVRPFLEKHLLHWLEVLSILGERLLFEGRAAIRKLLIMTQTYFRAEASPASGIINDAEIFLKAHGSMIQKYPLQVYGSCLVLSHPESQVKQYFAQSRATRLASIGSIRGGLISRQDKLNTIRIFNPHALTISPDNQMLAAYSPGQIAIADIETSIVLNTLAVGKPVREPVLVTDLTSPILAISFTQDQIQIMALTRSGHVYAWDTRVNENLISHGSVHCGGKWFEYGDINGQFSMCVATTGTTLYVWSFQKGTDSAIEMNREISERNVTAHISDVSLQAKSLTDWRIAFIDDHGKIFVWCGSQEARSELSCMGTHPPVLCLPKVAISACGSVIASSDAYEIWLWGWDGEKGSHLHRIFPGEILSPSGLAFFPSGKALAIRGEYISVLPILGQFTSEHEDTLEDGTEKSSPTCQIVSSTLFERFGNSYDQYTHISNPSKIISLKLASNMRTLLTASLTHRVLVWDIDTGVLQHEIPCHDLSTPGSHVCDWAISPNGSILALRPSSGTLNIWSLETSPATLIDFSPGPFHFLLCMEFSPDSKSLAISDSQSLSLWDVITHRLQWYRRDCDLRANTLKLSPDGKILVAFSYKQAFLVDTSTRDCGTKADWISLVPKTFIPWYIVRISFSETDRSVLFSVSDGNGGFQVLAWDLASRNIGLMDTFSQNLSGGVSLSYKVEGTVMIEHGQQAICLMTNQETYTAAGVRAVIAQDDGQFTVIDFDESRIHEI